jgi:RNA polymerase sigma factor (sigma-70 family)
MRSIKPLKLTGAATSVSREFEVWRRPRQVECISVESKSLDARLSQLSTSWTVLRQAQDGPADAITAAQQLLLQRYGGAVRRYLLAILRDHHAADDLTQEFGLRLVRGGFRNVDPQRGHFRNYVKTVLRHLVSDYQRKVQARARPLAADSPALANLACAADETDPRFLESWRDELLARTWEALAAARPRSYTVLRFRAANPKLPSEQMTEQLAGQLGKPLSAAGMRQMLHRARDKFADLLIEEVAQSLEHPTGDRVEEELRELGLLAYCQPALKRYARGC